MTESLRERVALEAAQAWRPIKSAPKDGTRIILGSFPVAYVRSSAWRGDGWWGWIDSSDYNQPTHWMPLPAPPSGDAT